MLDSSLGSWDLGGELVLPISVSPRQAGSVNGVDRNRKLIIDDSIYSDFSPPRFGFSFAHSRWRLVLWIDTLGQLSASPHELIDILQESSRDAQDDSRDTGIEADLLLPLSQSGVHGRPDGLRNRHEQSGTDFGLYVLFFGYELERLTYCVHSDSHVLRLPSARHGIIRKRHGDVGAEWEIHLRLLAGRNALWIRQRTLPLSHIDLHRFRSDSAIVGSARDEYFSVAGR